MDGGCLLSIKGGAFSDNVFGTGDVAAAVCLNVAKPGANAVSGAPAPFYAPVEARNYRERVLLLLFLKISSILKSGKTDLILAIVDKFGLAFFVDSSL